MRVTIIADASMSLETKISAYAFWAVSSRGNHSGHGLFKDRCASTAEAETKAVINAIHVAIAAGVMQSGDQLLVQTDALSAICALTGKLTKKRTIAKFSPILAAFNSLVQKHQLTVEFRHVRGHTKADVRDARYVAQRKVDRLARKTMRKALKQRVAT